MTKDDAYKRLTDYINILSGGDTNWTYTTARIKQFVKQGMTYNGIRYALWYQMTVLQMQYDGINFVPFIYDDAKKYWNDMQKIKQSVVSAKFNNKRITIEKKEHDDIEGIFE